MRVKSILIGVAALMMSIHIAGAADEAPKAAVFRGKVVDPAGKPVAGADVMLVWTAPTLDKRMEFEHVATTVTAGDGTFTVGPKSPNVPPVGQGMVVVRKAGLALGWANWPMRAHATERIVLAPAGSVSGRVVGHDGKLIGRARIQLIMGSNGYMGMIDRPTVADARGRFTIGLLPVGPKYKLLAAADGYGDEEREFTFKRPGALTIKDVVLELADKVVAGVVVDANGQPVAGAKVSARGRSMGMGWSTLKSAATDAAGRFEIKGLCKGEVSLSVRKDDHSGYDSVKAGDTNVKIVVRKEFDAPTTRPSPPDDDF